MTRKIWGSIIAVAVAVLIISFLIIMSVLYGHFSSIQTNQLKNELSIAAHGVEAGGIDWLTSLDAQGHRLTLVGSNGSVLYDNEADAASMENHANREEIFEALASGSGESERMSATLTEKTLYQAKRLADGTVLRISVTHNSVLTLVLGMLTPVLIVLVVAVVLSAILASRLAKRIVQPLNRIDLEHPLENDAYEELSPFLIRIAQQRRELDRQLGEMKRKRDELAVITDSMNEGLVLLNEKGTVLSINRAAQQQFHASIDCVGVDFLTVERDREVEQAISNALLTGHGGTTINRDGRQIEIDTSRILSDGQTAGIVLLTFDVTEKAQAEKRRREFSANVSHELKTPLQSIMGSAELMENGLVKVEDIPQFTGHIRTEATRLVTLIDDIIRLSQLDEGNELSFESVDLMAVANEAVKMLSEAAAIKNVTLAVTGSAVTVQGIPRLMHEIVYNLIDNAIKYNHDGGSVTVTISKEDNNAMLTVADTGIGIPREHQGRVFERFYRVDKSHSKATGGTGLGLSIVKHAAEAQHGSISLKSEVDKGTEICIRFPN